MNTVRVESWSELLDSLFADSWNTQLQRFRSPYAFRGLDDVEHPLHSSLIRLGGDFAGLEGHLLRNFRKYAHRDVVEHDSLWHWLSVAKHHGLPTRLMDWTYSPFVAMHFATADVRQFDRDGVIWAVNYERVHQLLPEQLQAELRRDGSNVFIVEVLAKMIRSLDELEQVAGSDLMLFFEPPSIDERIVNQFALFSVMSDPQAAVDHWLLTHPDLYRKIILPASLKREVRDKLDQANISERVLFPGLDGLGSWLTRYYSPLPPAA